MKKLAYQDGNKRTALVAADMSLKINGYRLQRIPLLRDGVGNDLSDVHVAVTTNQLSAEDLGRYNENVASKVDEMTQEIRFYRDGDTEY